MATASVGISAGVYGHVKVGGVLIGMSLSSGCLYRIFKILTQTNPNRFTAEHKMKVFSI